MNSREKGKRGERMWRDVLRAEGYAARRGQQFSGSAESPDVVCDGLPWIHFEVKCVERLNIWEAMEQAIRDCKVQSEKCKVQSGELREIANSRSPDSQGVECGMQKIANRRSPDSQGAEGGGQRTDVGGQGAGGKVAVVAHKRNLRGWLVTVRAEDFFRLLRGDFLEPKEFSDAGASGVTRQQEEQQPKQETKEEIE